MPREDYNPTVADIRRRSAVPTNCAVFGRQFVHMYSPSVASIRNRMWEPTVELAVKLNEIKCRKAKPGVHGDGAGLYLRVKPSGAKSWVLRVQFRGQRQDVGLGGYPADRSLAEAREEAARLRKLARRGLDAIAERDREKVIVPTFKAAMAAAHTELSKGWTDKNAKAFKATLEAHIVPKIGNLRVDQIEAEQIVFALSPIWMTKPVQARKLRIRIGQVLSYAKARGWRVNPVPAAAELKAGLPAQPRGGHFAAMPYADVPGFVATQLEEYGTAGRLALLFTIVTAARSGEVRQATWEQVNEEARTWSRPGGIMKNKEPHVVTLSDAALAILERARALSNGKGLIFPAPRGGELSDMTLTKALRDAKVAADVATVHGFRSSMRDWAAERMPTVPPMVAEMALAHTVGTRTEQAYLRSDLRDMRRALMEAWGRYVAPSLSPDGDNIIPFSGAAEAA